MRPALRLRRFRVAVPSLLSALLLASCGERKSPTRPAQRGDTVVRPDRIRPALGALRPLRVPRPPTPGRGGDRAAPRLPLKTLAARSGLAQYGRNNICYVAGMGSFFQLVGAFSDLPAEDDAWGEPKALARCESCVACLRQGPTAASASDRFLLRAERCLTYHNEAAGGFPSWIHPSWHHCLIGCLRCQTACPENRTVRKWFEDRAEFSERETALLVRSVPFHELPAETAAKLRSLEINEDYRLLCRNLSMIIDRESPAA